MHPENTKFLTRWREKNFSNNRPCCNAGPSSEGLTRDRRPTGAVPAWAKQQMLLMLRSAPGFGYLFLLWGKTLIFSCSSHFQWKKMRSFSFECLLTILCSHSYGFFLCLQTSTQSLFPACGPAAQHLLLSCRPAGRCFPSHKEKKPCTWEQFGWNLSAAPGSLLGG